MRSTLAIDDPGPKLDELPRVRASDLFLKGTPRQPVHVIGYTDNVGPMQLVIWVTETALRCELARKTGQVEYEVHVDWVPVHLGGERPRLQCSMAGCHRTGWALYLRDGWLVCRHCAGLPYRSQSLASHERMKARALKLRARLGDTSEVVGVRIPDKPKGMHWRTYGELWREIYQLERAYIEFIVKRLPMPRIPRSLTDSLRAAIVERQLRAAAERDYETFEIDDAVTDPGDQASDVESVVRTIIDPRDAAYANQIINERLLAASRRLESMEEFRADGEVEEFGVGVLGDGGVGVAEEFADDFEA